MRAAVLLLVVGLAAAACTPLVPPPMIPRHEGTSPVPEGTVTISVVAVAGVAGVGGRGLGLELRLAWQATEEAELGAGIGLARGVFDGKEGGSPAHTFFGMRFFGQWNPTLDHDWYALLAGVGFGYVSSGLLYVTVDGGAQVAGFGDGKAVPYLSLQGAISLPIMPGSPWDPEDEDEKPMSTVFWLGGSLGGSFGSHEDRGSIELTFLSGTTLGTASIAVMAVSAAGAHRELP